MKNYLYLFLFLCIPSVVFSSVGENYSEKKQHPFFSTDTIVRAPDTVYADKDYIKTDVPDKIFLRESENIYKQLNFCLGFGLAFPLIGLIILKTKQKIVESFISKYKSRNLIDSDRGRLAALEKYNKLVKKIILIRLFINLALLLLYLLALLFVVLLIIAGI